MGNLRRLLPSLDALILFEAAARLRSFTRAAEEIGVSQAAVSYAVKQLEEALGEQLFLRQHRSVETTEAGERFYNNVAIGLSHIRRATEDLQRSRQQDHVTLSMSTAFASHWMLPRLATLRRELRDVDLRLHTSDKDIDLVAEHIPLGIRRGDGNWDTYGSVLFAKEILFAVAAPSYVEAMGRPNWREGIAAHTLIHAEEPYRSRPTWSDWFDALAIPYDENVNGLALNDYSLVVQAAMEGEGIALGSAHIVQLLIETDCLVKVADDVVETGYGVYVVWPKHIPLTSQTEQVCDWLIQEARHIPGRFGPIMPTSAPSDD